MAGEKNTGAGREDGGGETAKLGYAPRELGTCAPEAGTMSFGHRTGLPDVEPAPPNVLVITGRVTPAVVPVLVAELESLLYDSGGALRVPDDRVDCDVGGVAHVDLALVEAVARLGLVARRAGGKRLRLRNAPSGLRDLLDLVGLADVVETERGTGGRSGGDRT
ncbi:STAS domain-containing protein [Streptomyces sp. NPDC052042]|uniref:STAS domain-containing protein n=1 Tax=Streptomyces sp. NPDC052042 TaxID=3365683 RepID=UPI0037D11C0B